MDHCRQNGNGDEYAGETAEMEKEKNASSFGINHVNSFIQLIIF